MQQHQLRSFYGSRKKPKRIGRGTGSGRGAFSTRGVKGQKARTGKKLKPSFEGGQTPLHKRLPKMRGFTPDNKTEYQIVNVSELSDFTAGATIDSAALAQKGLIQDAAQPVKVLGFGDLAGSYTLRVDRISASARQKIESAGGTIESLNPVAREQEKKAH